MKALKFCTLLYAASMFLMLTTIPASLAQEKSNDSEMYFDTKSAMYAANEEWLTFACELPDGQVAIGSRHANEMYYYSRYGLGNLLFRSGMGLHIVNNPLFYAHAKDDKGMPWYQKEDGNKIFFHHKMMQFVKRTASDKAEAQFPPKGAFPIYLEFSGGNPSFITDPDLMDFGTLRWDPAKMDKTLNPGAWGQALLKQVLWARDFFSGHKVIDGVTYLGNDEDDGGNGFRGAALTAMAITKSYALKTTLAYDSKSKTLGGVDPANYNPMNGPIYYPHQYRANIVPGSMPPKAGSFTVTDDSSDLFDVASLLWGESEFYFYTDPTVKDDYDLVFGDPKFNPKESDEKLKELFKQGKTIFPMKPHMLSKGLTVVNFKNMKGLHFRPELGTLVDRWSPTAKAGNRITTSNASIAIVALANVYNRLHDVKPVRDGAKMILTKQADFLLKHQNTNGSIAAGFTLGSSTATASTGPKTLLAQTTAMRGWLAAYQVTKDSRFLNAAEKCYTFINSDLWSYRANVYREFEGAKNSNYSGMNFGSTIGALRELAIVRSGARRKEVVAKLDLFFDSVARKNGLQISEIGMTGEMMPSKAKKAEMMKTIMALMKTDPAKAKKMKANMADSDKDGVPKPPFVKGTKFGAAPVQLANITISTP